MLINCDNCRQKNNGSAFFHHGHYYNRLKPFMGYPLYRNICDNSILTTFGTGDTPKNALDLGSISRINPIEWEAAISYGECGTVWIQRFPHTYPVPDIFAKIVRIYEMYRTIDDAFTRIITAYS